MCPPWGIDLITHHITAWHWWVQLRASFNIQHTANWKEGYLYWVDCWWKWWQTTDSDSCLLETAVLGMLGSAGSLAGVGVVARHSWPHCWSTRGSRSCRDCPWKLNITVAVGCIYREYYTSTRWWQFILRVVSKTYLTRFRSLDTFGNHKL